MKKTSKITIFISIVILGSTSSFLGEIVAGYLLEKIADCVVFNECPQLRNIKPDTDKK